MLYSQWPNVTIIFVNYNGARLLGDLFKSFLESIASQEYQGKIEIIAVDNNSDDNSVDLIKQKIPDAKIIKSKENVGYANAVNLGLSKVSGEYIIVLNNDTILPKNFVQKVIKRIKELKIKTKKETVLVPIQIVGEGDKILGTITIVNVLGQALYLDYLMPKDFFRRVYPKIPLCWINSYVDGAAFVLPRSLIKRLGGILFLPFNKMYFDDVELGLRLNLLGVPVIFCKDILIYHRLYSTAKHIVKLDKYVNYSINRMAVFLAFHTSVFKKLLALFHLVLYDTLFLLLISLRAGTSPLTTMTRYVRSLSETLKFAKFIESYYRSLGINRHLITTELRKLFSNIVLLPKWLCKSKLFKYVKPFINAYSLMLSLVFSKALFKAYARSGLRYRCINTLI